MTVKISNIAIVILAAGTSSRLGSPKQLLPYNGTNLLRHAVDAAIGTGCESVFVVLGANSELLRNELKDKPVSVLENPDWQEGMASSIRCGLKYITGTILRPDSVIFMVCDQPFASSNLLLELLAKKNETKLPIAASVYGDKPGTPALFHRSLFPLLMELSGDRGAGKLDIDTAEDFEQLKKKNDH
jgi:molybdenum cofactor cytidylyltransferase